MTQIVPPNMNICNTNGISFDHHTVFSSILNSCILLFLPMPFLLIKLTEVLCNCSWKSFKCICIHSVYFLFNFPLCAILVFSALVL